MAEHRIAIRNGMTPNENTAEVFFEPYSVEDTATVLDPQVLAYNNSGTKDGAYGSFRVPENYVGTASLSIVWTANATIGTVAWDWEVLTRSGAEVMGAAATSNDETTVPTKGGTVFTREEATITLDDADYAAGDEVLFQLFRDSVTDTMAAKAVVFGVYFVYADA